MVLLIVNETGAPAKKCEEKDSRYRLTVHGPHLALLCDVGREALPTEEAVQSALRDGPTLITSPGFFVTPFDGIIEGNAQKHPPLDLLMTDIAKRVSRRENVTMINRGVNGDAFLEQLMLALLQAIRPSAQYASQVVADEIAKEKQMQRLLQLEMDSDMPGAKDTHEEDVPAAARSATKGKRIPLSKELREKIRLLQKEYPHSQPGASEEAACRYTVLSAAHGDELVPPCCDGSYLTPSAFIANPPSNRRAKAESVAGRERSSGRVSYMTSAKRRSTLALLADLGGERTEEEEVQLPNNGWGATTHMFVFDGESSVMALPGVPKFEELIKSFAVDFWVRTDCKGGEGKRVLLQIMDGQREDMGQLFQIGMNWYAEMEESIRLFIRDSSNRVLEGLIPLRGTELTSGKRFHHFMLHVRNLDEGEIECSVDGRDITIQYTQQEHPIAFNSWPHRLFLGGYLDENHTPAMVLRGSILDLRFWTGGDERQPVVRWPLTVEDGHLVESTKTIAAEHHELLLNMQRVEERAPHGSPVFDGRLVVNMGPLSLWGELLHNWRLEIRFRTDVCSRMMTLIGVTDQKVKMQEIGVVLNAEPVFSKERFRYHDLDTTFYVVDAFGACCSALLRGTERNNLMDGEWHTLVWRCIDSEANRFNVKIDGVRQDLLYVTREGPTRFLPFDNWMCLGGHNVRNWKVKRPFTGQICRCFVTLRGYPYITLPMDEGPGAYVLQDRAHYRSHGLLIHAETQAVRRNDVVWMPVPEVSTDDGIDGPNLDVTIFKHNNLSLAGVVFTCDINSKGLPHEVIYDVVHGNNLGLDVVEQHVCDTRPQWGTWRAIPSECFKPLETATQLEETVNDVLAASRPLGHLMVVIRIGDCHITLLHVKEPEMPPEATYNSNMLKWHYSYAVEGHHGRRQLLLNRMIEGMEKVLIADTMMPFITARLGPLNAGGHSIISENIIRRLRESGKPWFLPAVLHTHLLNTQYGSSLHMVHHISRKMTVGEAASFALFNKRLYDRAMEKASIVIQRNWRCRLAKFTAARRASERQQRDCKVEEVRTLRMNAAVQAKVQLSALLITLHQVRCPAVPPIEASVEELASALERQGYTVDHMNSPDRASLLKAIAMVDSGSSSFIYISGYGGELNVRQAPQFGLLALHLQLQEGAARAAIELDYGTTFRSVVQRCRMEATGVKSKKKKKKAAAVRPKKQTAEEVELARRRIEEYFRTAHAELETEESFVRDHLDKAYDTDVQMLIREIRHTIAATREYIDTFKRTTPSGEPLAFIYPCESVFIEPYAHTVLTVEEVVRMALQRQMPPLGLQRVIAIDLQPMTPYSRGMACLASSTGHTLRIPYLPEQRSILTWVLQKAFEGYVPPSQGLSKYAVLTGGIETGVNERDWKSFATYVISKMHSIVPLQKLRALHEELNREVPFLAELIPVRDIVMDSEAKERRRRDRDAQKVNVELVFGVASAKVQSDMFAVFRPILDGLPLAEITFQHAVHVLFTEHNKGLDSLLMAGFTEEIEKCRPAQCAVGATTTVTAAGIRVSLDLQGTNDKLGLMQWVSNIVTRSLSWKLEINPLDGYRTLDVDYIEFLYTIRSTCTLRRYRRLLKQRYSKSIPEMYIRFLQCKMLRV